MSFTPNYQPQPNQQPQSQRHQQTTMNTMARPYHNHYYPNRHNHVNTQSFAGSLSNSSSWSSRNTTDGTGTPTTMKITSVKSTDVVLLHSTRSTGSSSSFIATSTSAILDTNNSRFNALLQQKAKDYTCAQNMIYDERIVNDIIYKVNRTWRGRFLQRCEESNHDDDETTGQHGPKSGGGTAPSRSSHRTTPFWYYRLLSTHETTFQIHRILAMKKHLLMNPQQQQQQQQRDCNSSTGIVTKTTSITHNDNKQSSVPSQQSKLSSSNNNKKKHTMSDQHLVSSPLHKKPKQQHYQQGVMPLSSRQVLAGHASGGLAPPTSSSHSLMMPPPPTHDRPFVMGHHSNQFMVSVPYFSNSTIGSRSHTNTTTTTASTLSPPSHKQPPQQQLFGKQPTSPSFVMPYTQATSLGKDLRTKSTKGKDKGQAGATCNSSSTTTSNSKNNTTNQTTTVVPSTKKKRSYLQPPPLSLFTTDSTTTTTTTSVAPTSEPKNNATQVETMTKSDSSSMAKIRTTTQSSSSSSSDAHVKENQQQPSLSSFVGDRRDNDCTTTATTTKTTTTTIDDNSMHRPTTIMNSTASHNDTPNNTTTNFISVVNRYDVLVDTYCEEEDYAVFQYGDWYLQLLLLKYYNELQICTTKKSKQRNRIWNFIISKIQQAGGRFLKTVHDDIDIEGDKDTNNAGNNDPTGKEEGTKDKSSTVVVPPPPSTTVSTSSRWMEASLAEHYSHMETVLSTIHNNVMNPDDPEWRESYRDLLRKFMMQLLTTPHGDSNHNCAARAKDSDDGNEKQKIVDQEVPMVADNSELFIPHQDGVVTRNSTNASSFRAASQLPSRNDGCDKVVALVPEYQRLREALCRANPTLEKYYDEFFNYKSFAPKGHAQDFMWLCGSSDDDDVGGAPSSSWNTVLPSCVSDDPLSP